MKKRIKLGWLGMENVREMLRLKELPGIKNNYSHIAVSVNAYRETVKRYLLKATELGIDYPKSCQMSEEELREAFGKKRSGRKEKLCKGVIDFEYLAKEQIRKGVTVQLLWQEHLEKYPNSYRYSQFAALLNEWKNRQKISLRKTYKAGEYCFTDYSGLRMEWIEKITGEKFTQQNYLLQHLESQ